MLTFGAEKTYIHVYGIYIHVYRSIYMYIVFGLRPFPTITCYVAL